MSKEKDLKFEDALKKLEKYAQEISNDDTDLDKAIKSYEKGIIEYNKCKDILDNAEQQVKIIGEDNE